MQALNLAYNDSAKKLWQFFILLELLIILSSLLLSYKIAFVIVLAMIFLFLVSLNLKITLMILIALSTFISYESKNILALGISILFFVLAAVLFGIYFKFCLNPIKIIKSKLNLPLVVFLTIALFNALRGLFYSYKITSLALESFVYLSLDSYS